LVYAVFLKADAVRDPTGSAEPVLPDSPIPIDDSMRLGSPSAPIVLVEYSDIQCGFCGRFARNVLPELKQRLIDTGSVQLVFRHLPLSNHALAPKAAEALECARSQGRFWEMHERLFAERADLTNDGLRNHATTLALDAEAFDACLTGGRYGAKVKADALEASSLSIRATPTFLLGTLLQSDQVRPVVRYTGLQSFDTLSDAVTELRRSSEPSLWCRTFRIFCAP
jgi:protein-disulfide isomerase